MTWINDTMRDFGNSIGLPELTLNDRGILDLDLPNDRRLRIAHLHQLPVPEVVLSRSQSLFYPQHSVLSALLKLNDFRNSTEWTVQTALSERELFIAVRIPERSFVVNVMEQAFAALQYIHTNIR